MSSTNKTWAIIGGAAALVLVPAGVSYAVVAANDDARPAISDPGFARMGQQDRARDGSNCDGDRPGGVRPAGGGRGWGQGMMDGSGPRHN